MNGLFVSTRRGFTLMELMIIIAIVAILAANCVSFIPIVCA